MSLHALKCTLFSPFLGEEGDVVTLTEICIPLEVMQIPDGLSCLVLNPATEECIGGGFFQDNVVVFATPIHVTSRQPLDLLWEMELADEIDDEEIA